MPSGQKSDTNIRPIVPILEFYSPDSHKVYTFLARNREQVDQIPPCPDDSGFRMERMISKFAITRNLDEGDQEAVDDVRMQAAMEELEKEMGGIDEENPDPKQMGSLLRKMSEMTGERMGGEMEELVRRLEEGADPERLEEEFGELLGDEMEDFGENGGDGSAKLRNLWKRNRAPEKDPTLYDYPRS